MMHKHINIEECYFDGRSEYQGFSSCSLNMRLVIETQVLNNDNKNMAGFFSLEIIESTKRSFLLIHVCFLLL